MKIEKLIKIFETLLPYYKEAIKTKQVPRYLHYGLCNTNSYLISSYRTLSGMFNHNGYYRNYIRKDLFLFPFYSQTKSISKSIIPRRDFLITEIKSLKKLLAKGYTHV